MRTTNNTGGNPTIDHLFTADPSAHVWGGKMWLYPSHDQDDATNSSSMDGHHVFSSSDLVNWTDYGQNMHPDDIPWARSGRLWAPDTAHKDGTFYYYYPCRSADNAKVIGVATSDSPKGPWVHQGVLMEADVTGGITNHHSVVAYKDQRYIFYHSIALSDHNNRPSVCIDYLYYNDDGTIQTVRQTEEDVDPVKLKLNPLNSR